MWPFGTLPRLYWSRTSAKCRRKTPALISMALVSLEFRVVSHHPNILQLSYLRVSWTLLKPILLRMNSKLSLLYSSPYIQTRRLWIHQRLIRNFLQIRVGATHSSFNIANSQQLEKVWLLGLQALCNYCQQYQLFPPSIDWDHLAVIQLNFIRSLLKPNQHPSHCRAATCCDYWRG